MITPTSCIETLDGAVVRIVRERVLMGELCFVGDVVRAIMAVHPGPWEKDPERQIVSALVRGRIRRDLVFGPVRGWMPAGMRIAPPGRVMLEVTEELFQRLRAIGKRSRRSAGDVFERAMLQVIAEHSEPTPRIPRPAVPLPPHRHFVIDRSDHRGSVYVFGQLSIGVTREGQIHDVDVLTEYMTDDDWALGTAVPA